MSSEISEYREVTAESFVGHIRELNEPAVFRGAVNHWPAVKAALGSEHQLYDYFSGMDSGEYIDTLLLSAETKGHISYLDELTGFNYQKRQYPISAIIKQLIKIKGKPDAVRIAAQSALVSRCLPHFSTENVNPWLTPDIQPRIWIGNNVLVPAHFDDADNFACVISGIRKFTLFPPDQVGNLYIGPLDYAPTGAPVSLVNFTEPDFKRFPKAEIALANARTAELNAGDMLYIPALWWHQVESAGEINILCNYWWNGPLVNTDPEASPFDSLLHSLLHIRRLPASRKKAWQAMFNHFVFSPDQDVFSHIPDGKKGILGADEFEREQAIKQWLIKQLQKH